MEVLQGHAKIINPWPVEIALADGGKQLLTTRNIVIAAVARPLVPPLPGLSDVAYVTSDTLWERFASLDEAPKRLVVLGGGPIGCELAQSFARLGSQVTQVEMAPRLMMREDLEVSGIVADALRADGVRVLTGHKALRVEKLPAGTAAAQPADATPVSYTHLDVYKRQVAQRTAGSSAGSARRHAECQRRCLLVWCSRASCA